MVIVLAAFFASGGLNAGTPLAIASTAGERDGAPGERLEQQEDREDVEPRLDGLRLRRHGLGGPHHDVRQADRDDPDGKGHEEVGREGEDHADSRRPRRLPI